MRKSDGQRWPLLGRLKNGLFPVLAGTALLLTYPSLVSYQDIASLTQAETGFHKAGATSMPRWLTSLNEGAGVSNLITGSISNGKAETSLLPGNVANADMDISKRLIQQVRVERQAQTVNRSLKGARVVQATIKRPPDQFSAGSVVERQSFLSPLDLPKDTELAFVKAKSPKEALQVASAFQMKKPKVNKYAPKADLPVMVASLVTESQSNILAYGEEPQLKRSPFAEILEDNAPINIVPKLGKGDHAWAAEPLPKSSYSKKQQECLTAGIYFEARGEPVRGQAAVSQVILNRVKNPTYPNTICGVVYQNKHWRNRCQFSFACDTIKDKVRDRKRWEVAQYVARETTKGRIWFKEVGSSTHYHATYVNPKWARSMKRVGKIGLHIFYRTYGGGWS
ncbi:MAG: cell wall hydrolase [Salaquimonas sp.]